MERLNIKIHRRDAKGAEKYKIIVIFKNGVITKIK
jgi:hypothetical protein